MRWDRTAEETQLLEFTSRLIAFRHEHPIFHRPKFFQGRQVLDGLKDIDWLRPDGAEMQGGDWDNVHTRAFGLLLCGDDMGVTTFEGHPIRDDTFYLVFNAYHDVVPFLLPGGTQVRWQLVINTSLSSGFAEHKVEKIAGTRIMMGGRSFRLYRQVRGSDEEAKSKPERPVRRSVHRRPAFGDSPVGESSEVSGAPPVPPGPTPAPQP